MSDKESPSPVPVRDPSKLNSPMVDQNGNITSESTGPIDLAVCFYNSVAFSSGAVICVPVVAGGETGQTWECQNDGSWGFLGGACDAGDGQAG